MFTKIRDALKGKKAYLIGIAAVLLALGSYASDELTGKELISAVFVAVEAMAIRAGIATGKK